MWSRVELKERAKAALKRNYWKAVLVSLIIIVLGTNFNYSFSNNDKDKSESKVVSSYNTIKNTTLEFDDVMEEFNENIESDVAVAIIIIVVFIIAFIMAFCVIFAFTAFVINPIYVGIAKFMLKSNDDIGKISDLGYGYDHNYKNMVKTLFIKEIKIFLWALLLIIPGIIKRYEYRLVEYILAENPEMNTKEALAMSKSMMNGNKWAAFVLDLSFIPWYLFGLVTIGIGMLFYTIPYKKLTNAAFYRKLQELSVVEE